MSLEPTVFYQKGNTYSFTINPDDCHQYLGKENRLKSFFDFSHQEIALLFNNNILFDYKFVIELSEPKELLKGKAGARYHLHGWVLFKKNESIFKFLDTIQYKLTRLGYTELDIVNDIDAWESYMMKQQSIFGKQKTILTNLY